MKLEKRLILKGLRTFSRFCQLPKTQVCFFKIYIFSHFLENHPLYLIKRHRFLKTFPMWIKRRAEKC